MPAWSDNCAKWIGIEFPTIVVATALDSAMDQRRRRCDIVQSSSCLFDDVRVSSSLVSLRGTVDLLYKCVVNHEHASLG